MLYTFEASEEVEKSSRHVHRQVRSAKFCQVFMNEEVLEKFDVPVDEVEVPKIGLFGSQKLLIGYFHSLALLDLHPLPV